VASNWIEQVVVGMAQVTGKTVKPRLRQNKIEISTNRI
jgi:hypothetical protein